jgi:uncharacterized protein YecT (DUF1311 family)
MKFILIISLLITAPFLAKDNYEKCLDKAVSTLKTRECLEIKYTDLDNQLNLAYTNLQKLTNDEQKKALKKSQRAWLNFRKAECDFAGVYGTISQIIVGSCYITLTEARIKDLKEYITQYQDGNSNGK